MQNSQKSSDGAKKRSRPSRFDILPKDAEQPRSERRQKISDESQDAPVAVKSEAVAVKSEPTAGKSEAAAVKSEAAAAKSEPGSNPEQNERGK